MNISKYAKLTKRSNDTALRDIQELKTPGIFIQNSSVVRRTSYYLSDKQQELSQVSEEYDLLSSLIAFFDYSK